MKPVYYNEFDKFAAEWLRELIKAGHIAPGIVDDRSIEDVTPNDLRGFTQHHFFAGIGVWSYALRRAGWPDDRQVWTASCPCQPFSAAGKGAGFTDERHLWPSLHHLIQECKPAVVLGEQVASKDAGPWIDLVHADLEALGYAFGCVPFPSAGVGAPHIRDRAYWVAYCERRGVCTCRRSQDVGETGSLQRADGQWERVRTDPCECGAVCGMADAGMSEEKRQREYGWALLPLNESKGFNLRSRAVGGLADDQSSRRREECTDDRRLNAGDRAQGVPTGLVDGSSVGRPGPTNGHWADVDWLHCRDGKWRPVEPSTFPLAHGSPARVGRLRGYGNAVNAQAAQVFIESLMT